MGLNHQDKLLLKRLFGHRARLDESELRLYSRDVSDPPAPVKMLIRQRPDAVVVPESEADLLDLLRFANEHGTPLVPRGGGTAGYGGAMPVRGGIVVDLTRLDRELSLSADGTEATFGAGLTFQDAELRLKPKGKALRIMPTSAPAATIGGWLAQGGAGLGSLRYGWIHDVVIAVRMVLPNGEIRTFAGSELDVVADMEGTTGFITAVTMKLRDDEPILPFLATFPDVTALQKGVDALRMHPLWTMLVHNPDFNELRQEATGEKTVPKGQFSVVIGVEKSRSPGRDAVQKAVEAAGGKLLDDKKAESEWALRFGVFRARRLGPSMVPGEAVVPTARLAESLARIHEDVKAAHWNMEGIVAGDETVWFAYALDDERRPQFPAAFGAAIAMLGAAKKVGGRTLGTGVYLSTEASRVFPEDRIDRVRKFQRAVDPNGVMNPGKVFGAKIRLAPTWAPAPSVAQALKPGEPMLKLVHGSSYVRYQRLEEARNPHRRGVSAALGAAGGGAFGAKWAWDLIVADVDVGIRTASASARAFTTLSASPLGWVRWARDYVMSDKPFTPHQFEMLHGEGIAAMADLASGFGIRYSQMLQELKTHLVAQGFRPLPAHRRIAEHVAARHNQFGAPHEERTEWAEGLTLTAQGDVLLFVDDTVSYHAPHVARNAEELLRRGGKRVAYLGADEWSSGAVLLHTGQRAAARDTVKHNIEAINKSGVKELVTPDPYALWAFKNDYPAIAAELGLPWTVKVFHVMEYAAKLVEAGKIPQGGAVNATVALHHPPVLTALGVTEEMVRKVLGTIPGLQVATLIHHGRNALDVGASGAVPDTYPEVCDKAARLVISEARAAGADLIVSSDPASELILRRTGARVAKERGVTTTPEAPGLGAPLPDVPAEEDEAAAATPASV